MDRPGPITSFVSICAEYCSSLQDLLASSFFFFFFFFLSFLFRDDPLSRAIHLPTRKQTIRERKKSLWTRPSLPSPDKRMNDDRGKRIRDVTTPYVVHYHDLITINRYQRIVYRL